VRDPHKDQPPGALEWSYRTWNIYVWIGSRAFVFLEEDGFEINRLFPPSHRNWFWPAQGEVSLVSRKEWG
jgi:hypothetical protein